MTTTALHSLPPRETILPGDTKMGTVGGGDRTCNGLFFIRHCKRFILLVNEGAILNIGLTWQGTDDIDLELWRNDGLLDASLTCQACGVGTSQEGIARFISPGEYELRVVLWSGSGSSFTLTTRVN